MKGPLMASLQSSALQLFYFRQILVALVVPIEVLTWPDMYSPIHQHHDLI